MDEQRQIEELERESEHVGDHVEQAREDWQRKQADDKVPGAEGDVTDMDGDDTPETDYPSKR